MKRLKIMHWVLQLTLALIIFFGFLRPFVVEAFRIPTASMEETLLVGDHLLVLKVVNGQIIPWTDRMQPLLHDFRGGAGNLLMPATGGAEVGEVLVFKCPARPQTDFIKRVVAVSGDTVFVRNDTLHVNGEPSARWAVACQDRFRPSPIDNDWPGSLDQLYGMIADLKFLEIMNSSIRTKDDLLAYVVPENHVFMLGDNRDHSSDSRVWGAVPLDLVKGEALVIYWSWMPGNGLPKLDRLARLIR